MHVSIIQNHAFHFLAMQGKKLERVISVLKITEDILYNYYSSQNNKELAGACQSLSTRTIQSPFNITLANNYWRQTFLRDRKPRTLNETL